MSISLIQMLEKDRLVMAEVFINYRYEDSQSSASRLARELKEKIDTQSVFIEQTGNGVRTWNQQAEEQIIQCKVFVVVIGKQWHSCQNPDTGIRRISDPDDVVRREIELALQHQKPIIVVFVDGVTKGAIKKSFANDEGIKHLQVIFDAKHFPLDQQVIPYTYNLDLEKIVRAIEEIIIPPDHIPYETAIALFKDSVKWLILLRQRNDVVLYRIQTAHIWDLLLDSNIPIELKNRSDIRNKFGFLSNLKKIFCDIFEYKKNMSINYFEQGDLGQEYFINTKYKKELIDLYKKTYDIVGKKAKKISRQSYLLFTIRIKNFITRFVKYFFTKKSNAQNMLGFSDSIDRILYNLNIYSIISHNNNKNVFYLSPKSNLSKVKKFKFINLKDLNI